MYKDFSEIYDRLMNSQIDYKFIYNNILKLSEKHGIKINSVLEAGIGSGNMAEYFLKDGISVDGFDISDEMLDKAKIKLSPFSNINLLKGDLKTFLSNERYDLIYSFFDVLNYVKNIDNIEKFIKNSYSMLNENGLMMFDINSEYKLRTYLGNNDFICEEEDVFYTWRNRLTINHIDFNIDFFIPNNEGKYVRINERQRQYIHKKEKILDILTKNNFEILEILDFDNFSDLKKNSFRILFVLKKN